jgi:hypothetical protein
MVMQRLWAKAIELTGVTILIAISVLIDSWLSAYRRLLTGTT